MRDIDSETVFTVLVADDVDVATAYVASIDDSALPATYNNRRN